MAKTVSLGTYLVGLLSIAANHVVERGIKKLKNKRREKNMKKTILIIAVVFSLGLWISESISQNVPLPSEIKIVAPSSDVSPAVAAFSGKWKGIWDYSSPSVAKMDAILIVEEIDNQKAKIIYAWGDFTSPSRNIKKGYVRATGRVISEPARIEFPGKENLDYTFYMNDDLNSITGSLSPKDQSVVRAKIFLKRTK